MARMNFNIKCETRLCEVNGELGYFHIWEQWSYVFDASPMIGGQPEGQFSHVYGIVEFSDGVRRVDPYQIKFCDDENAILNEMNRRYQEEKKLNKAEQDEKGEKKC